jgi:curli biogenesis system outer membrane secretion channel CsgG
MNSKKLNGSGNSNTRPRILRLSRMFPALLVLCAMVAPLHAQQQRKLRIAIMKFQVDAVLQQQAATQLGVRGDLGAVLSDLLLSRLVQDGKFTVIDRTDLDKVIHEQNLSNSDRVDPATAAKIGKILGADAIIIGSVTEFSGEQKESRYGGLMRIAKVNGLSWDQKTSKVSVAISGHVVNTTTDEVLAAATGEGDAVKGESGFQQAGSNSNIGSSTTSKDIGSPLANEATAKAIASMATQLEMAPELNTPVVTAPPPRVGYTGVVADVSGNTLILTVGTTAGIRVGDVVQVSRPGRTIKNPTTGKVLKVIEQPLGKATITQADADSSTASYSGTALIKIDDQVSSTP